MVPYAGHSLFGDFIFPPLPSTNQSQAAKHDRSPFGSVQLIFPSFRDFPQRNYTITKKSTDLTASHHREASAPPRRSHHPAPDAGTAATAVAESSSVNTSGLPSSITDHRRRCVEPVSLSEEIRRSEPSAIPDDTSNPRPSQIYHLDISFCRQESPPASPGSLLLLSSL